MQEEHATRDARTNPAPSHSEPDIPVPTPGNGELAARFAWIRWAAATRFGRRPHADFLRLVLMPPPVDPTEAKKLYDEVNVEIDAQRYPDETNADITSSLLDQAEEP